MSTLFDTDIYEIAGTVNELQRQYMPWESESTRSIGIYGYLNDIQSTQIQNAIISSSEMANEMWPGRAKFEKNIIAHSIIQNIVDINAVPARMQIYLGIEESELEELLKHDQLILDKECELNVAGLPYHLPYDIIITRNIVVNNEKVYTAKYKVDRPNELCQDLTNPYLPSPFVQIYQTKRFIMISCMIMQVQHTDIPRPVLSSSPIENKTLEFDFEDQLASFVVKATDGDKEIYLKPIFEGIGIENNLKDFCYYTYEDSTNIRVRFDSISYMPKMNTEINILLKTTRGSEGIFEYNQSRFVSFSSEKYDYNSLNLFMIPRSDSEQGRDRKSTEELKRLLPKEALARGAITNMQDLINYFQMLDNDYARMLFQKKVDNQFERTYYSFLVMKDIYDNVVPTNTLDLLIDKESDFDTHENRKRTLKPGCAILYREGDEYGKIVRREDVPPLIMESDVNFIYTIPFTLVVTDDPLYVSYYMTVMNYPALLRFTYINEACPVQFISTSVIWKRSYSEDPNIYKLYISCLQNIDSDYGMIKLDENGDVDELNVKVVAVFYNSGTYDDKNEPYRYEFMKLSSYETTDNYTLQFELDLETDDKINDDSKIKIFDMYVPTTTNKMYGYFSDVVKVRIYILARLVTDNTEDPSGDPIGINYGRHDLDTIIPEGLEDYTVTNMYEVENGLNTYFNFSEIVRSTVNADYIQTRYDQRDGFYIDSVPLIKRSYIDNESNMQMFVRMLSERKAYLDRGRYLLENNFNIDFKLFNTYGPSKIYSTDINGERIVDRVNLSLYFEIKLIKQSEAYTKDYIIRDIKKMIEDLNDMTNLHIPNLITKITNSYRQSIEYIEFLGYNGYGPGCQHLYRNEYDNVTIVPEFLTVNVTDDMVPDINIRIV